jgi:phospholipid/cholesterol/gamma-HCH transport system substrate-binding protein
MSAPRTSSRRRTTRLAAVTAAGAMLLSGCSFSVYDLPLPGGADLGDNPYEVTVQFRDVLDLVPQSTVKVDDVSVGIVDDVELDGYVAEVTLKLNGDVELPDNAEATIRQTSLLGEKFVSLAPPASNPSPDKLGDGDVITLDRSGRNTEVEEVLGALSLVLNGGGVAQLKTISQELSDVFEGREGTVRSVLDQIGEFMSQLDGRKTEIVKAIERVNSLAISLNGQTDTLDLALKELPQAIASVDRQRDDLVKMLSALSDLSSVGTRVIQASSQNTITSLNSLAPVLTEFADAGDDFVNSLQIFLTYPFMDAIVGKNAQQARDLHMGDYTNLSIDLQVNLKDLLTDGLGVPGGPTIQPCDLLPDPQVGQICKDATGEIITLTGQIIKQLPGGGGGGGGLPSEIPTGLPTGIPGVSGGSGSGSGSGGLLGGAAGLGRAPVGKTSTSGAAGELANADLAAMLVWGVMPR